MSKNKILFYFFILFFIIIVFYCNFFPTMDGPAHLYNSFLLKEMIIGNDFLKDYFTFNDFFIPNWIANLILALFMFIFNAILAEKLLIIFYIIGMILSFRYLIKQLNPDNEIFSFLIFPFIFSFLFRLGFYNFSIAFIFYFLVIGFWLKHKNDLKIVHFLVLFFLITALYYSNVLIFGFAGLSLGFDIVVGSIRFYKSTNDFSKAIVIFSKKIFFLLGVSIFSLISMLLFYSNVEFFSNSDQFSYTELIKWINDVRPLITYSYENEVNLTSQILHIYIFLISITIYKKFPNLDFFKFKISVNFLTILFPIILSFLLIFIVRDGASAGMMSNRLVLMFYVFLTILIAKISVNSSISKSVLILYVIISLVLFMRHQILSVNPLNKDAVSVFEARKHIKENSIVLPVNLSDNWLQGHFSNYLGLEKPVVILENYEASVGWFPLKWNNEKMPYMTLPGNRELSGVEYVRGNKKIGQKQIDYICITGNIKNIDDPKYFELKTMIRDKFKIEHISENSFVHIYERN